MERKFRLLSLAPSRYSLNILFQYAKNNKRCADDGGSSTIIKTIYSLALTVIVSLIDITLVSAETAFTLDGTKFFVKYSI